MTIEISGLSLAYSPEAPPAVDDLSLTVGKGQLFVLLGPSGCGKTSTMRCIAGLEVPNTGKILVDGEVMLDTERHINVPTHRRHIGMVFQSYAIWPHKTVYQNVAFPLQMQGVKGKKASDMVSNVLDKVGLSGYEGRGASNLSGGQMQRVALARSIAMQPSVLLFDEPLSNLDARLRENLRFEIRALQEEFGFTSVYVTHDQSEALALGDQIAVMRSGRIVQQGTPEDLYYKPDSDFVAGFLGVGNRIIGTVSSKTAAGVVTTLGDLDLQISSTDTRYEPGDKVILCVRDEAVAISTIGSAPRDMNLNVITGVIEAASFLGSETRYKCLVGTGQEIKVTVPGRGKFYSRGEKVALNFPSDAVLLVPAAMETDG